MRRASLTSILTLCHLAALVAAATVVSAAGLPKWDKLSRGYSYDQYLRDIGKERPASAEEHARRARIFAEELDAVLEHNADGTQLYRQGLNQFSDRTPEEKATAIMGFSRNHFLRSNRRAGGRLSQAMLQSVTAGTEPMRRELDYRRANPPVLTAVKDQGTCGSCWAFATTETIESHVAIQTGRLFDLSMQQLVSCVPPYNATFTFKWPNETIFETVGGCGGYMPDKAMEYIVTGQNGKMSQEYEIPYQSYWAWKQPSDPQYKPTPPCMNAAQRTFTTVNVTGHEINPRNDDLGLQNVLFEKGPMITVIYVPMAMMSYEAGIFAASECIMNEDMMPSHLVQIVGYGFDAAVKQAYWIVRNSWAPIWGENGYIRLLRTDPTMCGKMSLPTNASDTYFDLQPACGTCGVIAWTLYPLV